MSAKPWTHLDARDMDRLDLASVMVAAALDRAEQSEAENARLTAALDRVRAVHENSLGACLGDHGYEGRWPCDTIRAIDGADQ